MQGKEEEAHEEMMEELYRQARDAMEELVTRANLTEGKIVVVGCSTSEILGERIGTSGTLEVAREVLRGLMEPVVARGGVLAVQCCEHLNRALVLPRAALEKRGLTEVCAQPWEHAGGSMATAYFMALDEPCLAETIAADAGLDIGDTLIGMHLRRVAVPVRLSQKTIGRAHLCAAVTRPPLIGGERARYPQKIR